MSLQLVIDILISGIAFFIGAKILSGVEVKNFTSAIIVAVIIALLNGTLGVVIGWITPDKTLNFLTFGLFQFLINAFIIWVANKFTKDFYVKNFLNAIFLAVIVSVISGLGARLLNILLLGQ